jgi:hypothetical protein
MEGGRRDFAVALKIRVGPWEGLVAFFFLDGQFGGSVAAKLRYHATVASVRQIYLLMCVSLERRETEFAQHGCMTGAGDGGQ